VKVTVPKLADMSYIELEVALKSTEMAIIPIGSCEQHGPNMTLQTDAVIANALAEIITERLAPRALLVPGIPYGFSWLHEKFQGMISLRYETLAGLIEDIVVSLKRMGIESFLIVNGHGHNTPPLQVVMTKLRHEQHIRIASCIWLTLASDVIERKVTSKIFGHACEMETSVALYLAPEIIKHEQLTSGDVKKIPPYSRGSTSLSWPFTYDQLTRNGSLGDARLASFEIGKEIVETTISRTIEFVESVLVKKDTQSE
jgi:creatinine amidohydrolase